MASDDAVDGGRPAPLADLRVVDLSTVLAGPNCARYLADFGADVIKVERPDGGDSLRNMAWRDPRDGEGLWWKLVNRNKRVIALDLKADDDLAPAALAAGRRRRAGRELPARHARTAGPRARRPARRQPTAGHHPRHRLRPDRPVRRSAGLRDDRRGDERPVVDQRLPRRPAAAAADRAHRRGHRHRRRVRDDGRAAQRAGPGGRRVAAGEPVPDHGAAHRAVPTDRAGAGTPRRRPAVHGAAGHLRVQRRPLGGRQHVVGFGRGSRAASAGCGRRRTLRHLRRADGTPRRTGGRDVATGAAATPRPRCCASSPRRRPRSAR